MATSKAPPSPPPDRYLASSNPNSPSPSVPTDPNRLTLLGEYLSLQPSDALCLAASRDQLSAQNANVFAARLNLSRKLHLSETPSESQLVDNALQKCCSRADTPSPSMRNADDLRRRQRVVLARLYPSSVSLQPILANIADMRKKLSMFRKAIRDQTLALAKLNDASNLLLLIADHVQILTSCYANSCTSSSSDWSSDDDAVRVGCLGRSEESRSPIYLSSVPANYRVRYLRRCWGFASDALVAAVDFSSYLSCQLERDGQTQLVPGIEGLSRPSMSLFELPGGLTVVFRSEMLQKMANDAKEMREIVGVWQLKQRKFISRIRKDMGRLRKSIGQQEIVVCGLRQKLLAEEFGSRFEVDS